MTRSQERLLDVRKSEGLPITRQPEPSDNLLIIGELRPLMDHPLLERRAVKRTRWNFFRSQREGKFPSYDFFGALFRPSFVH